MKLEICIPTYNRPDRLRETVSRLLPQLGADASVRILDNCSPEPVTYALLGLPAPLLQEKIQIERNALNIGGNANIASSFLRCQGDYMWLLSDDDILAEDAVAIILRNIAAQPNTAFFSYALPQTKRGQDRCGDGLDEFLAAVDSWGDLMLISNDVYRVADFRAHILKAFEYTYCQAPQMVILLEKLRYDGGRFHLGQQVIILGNAPNSNQGWSLTRHGMARMALLDLPLTGPQRARLKALIVGGVQLYNHSLVHILSVAVDRDTATARYCLRKLYRDNFAEPFSFRYWVLYVLAQLALFAPGVSLKLIRRLSAGRAVDTVLKLEASSAG